MPKRGARSRRTPDRPLYRLGFAAYRSGGRRPAIRLYVTKPSPYARKAWVAVLELELEKSVQVVELPARMPSVPKPDLDALNPLGKVPALITDEGELIADSPVIVAYLDALAGNRLIPVASERWRTLTLEALADGCMDAGVVIRVEHLKDEAKRDQGDIAAYTAKIERTFDLLEYRADRLPSELDAGALSLICAAEWLVFRSILPDPLASRPRLAAWAERYRDRPALIATRPRA